MINKNKDKDKDKSVQLTIVGDWWLGGDEWRPGEKRRRRPSSEDASGSLGERRRLASGRGWLWLVVSSTRHLARQFGSESIGIASTTTVDEQSTRISDGVVVVLDKVGFGTCAWVGWQCTDGTTRRWVVEDGRCAGLFGGLFGASLANSGTLFTVVETIVVASATAENENTARVHLRIVVVTNSGQEARTKVDRLKASLWTCFEHVVEKWGKN